MPAQVFFTPSGVRLRRRSRDLGDLNWLLLPGGPGIGSESLHELADTLNVPGSIWMVDLPGDGSNVNPPGAPPDPFSCWPMVLVEAAQALPNAIYVGHSTGGMYLLSTPKVEQRIVGLALVSAAPDARWRGRFIQMTRRHPLPAVDAATAIYKYKRTSAAMRDIAIASAEWSFTTQSLDVGRKLLGRMPYNGLASNTERKTEAAAQLFLSSQPQGITGCYWTATSGRPRRAKGTSSIDQSCRAMTRSRSLERRGALALACVAVLPVVALAMVFLS